MMSTEYDETTDPEAQLAAMQAQNRADTNSFAEWMAQQLADADAENAARHQEQAEIEDEMWGLVEQQRRAFGGDTAP